MNKLLNCDCAGTFGGWAPLVLRVALGSVFAWHGYDKVFNTGVSNVGGFLGSLGIPAPSIMAYILAYGELIAGILLIVGLFTHWAAKFTVVVALVALFTVHISKGFSIANGGYEYIMLILASSISVLITGAGKYSLDTMWRNKNASTGTN